MRRSRNNCFRISTFCFSPAERLCTGAPRSTRKGMRAMSAASARSSRRQCNTIGISARASTRFSKTDMLGTRVKCW